MNKKYSFGIKHIVAVTGFFFLSLASISLYAQNKSALLGADANELLLVDSAWLLKHLKNDQLVIVDVRVADRYKKSHIKNAINIPVAKTFSRQYQKDRVASIRNIQTLLGQAGIDQRSNVLIYDDGTFIDAGRMFWVLEAYGQRRVALLNYGFSGWQKEALPVSTKVIKLPEKIFIAEVQPSKIKTKLHTRLSIGQDDRVILDARSVEEYRGKKSITKRLGHIPSAISIPWTKNFIKQNGVSSILTTQELQQLYQHIDKSQRVITYCNKGKQSSFSYFILRTLGYDVSHYDGSWFEWSNDEYLPIEIKSQ